MIKAAIIGGVGFVIWRVLQPKYEIGIVLTPEGVRRVDGVDKRLRHEVEEFLQQNLPEQGKVVIRGIRQPGGRLRLVFRGPVHEGQQQRFRNFLLMLLK
ncbi:MAG: hypothetical protein CMJ64_04460 [Planctomycetaceae bacterium]|nr:hypothetical protein [Planctomycetaceae bacterium]